MNVINQKNASHWPKKKQVLNQNNASHAQKMKVIERKKKCKLRKLRHFVVFIVQMHFNSMRIIKIFTFISLFEENNYLRSQINFDSKGTVWHYSVASSISHTSFFFYPILTYVYRFGKKLASSSKSVRSK